jgi:hypothetical protein
MKVWVAWIEVPLAVDTTGLGVNEAEKRAGKAANLIQLKWPNATVECTFKMHHGLASDYIIMNVMGVPSKDLIDYLEKL